MKLTKEQLEKLYATMSVSELASHLGMSRSTLYYHMKKLGVERRSKSSAQKNHLKNSPHQRSGKKHTDESKERISDGARLFWESGEGEEHKKRISSKRLSEWEQLSDKEKTAVTSRLKNSKKPSPGELSKIGKAFADYLSDKYKVTTGIKLTPDHVSDIILEEQKIVIEFLLPIQKYHDKEPHALLLKRYNKITEQLMAMGYKVLVVHDYSNSVSRARCKRLHNELEGLIWMETGTLHIMS